MGDKHSHQPPTTGFNPMSRTTTYTITIGLESPELTVEQCRAFAFIAAGKYFPEGHTIVEATGRWTSDRGVIDEPSLIITVIGQDVDDAVRGFVSDYKRGCFQDCVLVQVTRPETFWV